jgi:hypothetical protein
MGDGAKMKSNLSELWQVFWAACLETPRGMAAPFVAFWHTAIHNPVLETLGDRDKISSPHP